MFSSTLILADWIFRIGSIQPGGFNGGFGELVRLIGGITVPGSLIGGIIVPGGLTGGSIEPWGFTGGFSETEGLIGLPEI